MGADACAWPRASAGFIPHAVSGRCDLMHVYKDHWLLGGGQLGEGQSIWEAVLVIQRGYNGVLGLGGGRRDGEKQRGLGVERMALLMDWWEH